VRGGRKKGKGSKLFHVQKGHQKSRNEGTRRGGRKRGKKDQLSPYRKRERARGSVERREKQDYLRS